MLPSPPQGSPAPEIDRLLAQFQTKLHRDLGHRDMTPERQEEISAFDGQLTRAAADPAHPLRRLLLLAESAGYERGHQWVEAVFGGAPAGSLAEDGSQLIGTR